MSNIFFTSDHHFGHKGVIKHSKRPFRSVEEMNETMIKRWNERIRSNDTVYHLGDIGLMSSRELEIILYRLNGKIHLIKGNHDDFNQNCKDRFEWFKDYHELKLPDPSSINNRLIIMMHYPMMTWKGKYSGAIHLFGHSHGRLPKITKRLALDVGVDCHNFYPISYEEILNIINTKVT
jgi:calcineurin-like phosphoesterase family protein